MAQKIDMLQIKTELKLFMKMSQLSFQCPEVNNLQVVKGKGKVKFSLEQAMKAQRGSRCMALLFLQPQR